MNGVLVQKVLESLHELADIEYQKRVWYTYCPDEISSFTEAVCGLFDDSGLQYAFDHGEIAFSPAIDEKIRLLDNKLQEVDDYPPLSVILHDPNMKQVRKMAKELLELLEQEGFS